MGSMVVDPTLDIISLVCSGTLHQFSELAPQHMSFMFLTWSGYRL